MFGVSTHCPLLPVNRVCYRDTTLLLDTEKSRDFNSRLNKKIVQVMQADASGNGWITQMECSLAMAMTRANTVMNVAMKTTCKARRWKQACLRQRAGTVPRGGRVPEREQWKGCEGGKVRAREEQMDGGWLREMREV